MADAQQIITQPIATKVFFDAVGDAAGGVGKQVTAEVAQAVLKDNKTPVPAVVESLLSKFKPEHHGLLLDAVRDGSSEFERLHGRAPDPSLVEFAVFQADRGVTKLSDLGLARLDSATNNHHDQLSLVPATPITAIMAQFSEAIPFAAYLPADLKNNEARLAIMDNKADSDYGDYAKGDSLSGIAGGQNYLDAERLITVATTANSGAGPFPFAITVKNDGSGGTVPVLRGRTVVIVNGIARAFESRVTAYGSGSSTFSGSVKIGATTYTLGGSINTDTGVGSITTSAAWPGGATLQVSACIDFEKAPQLIPYIGTEVTPYSLFAHPNRGALKSTIDAMTQMQNELALDPRGQAMLSLRAQYNQERHYRVLGKMKAIGAGITGTWDYDYANQIEQKDFGQLWLNLMPVLANASQRMAESTIDHGIDTLYVGKKLMSRVRGLPSSIWQPSGLTDRPGVYRLGRLFNLFDVYYTPKGITETSTASEIIAIGRGTQVARSPIVLGDAVPPIFLPLAMDHALETKDGWYTRNFTEVNPHEPSAMGAALISVTNIDANN